MGKKRQDTPLVSGDFFHTQASEELTFDGGSQHLSLSVGMAIWNIDIETPKCR
jgi:hypothetical protein